MNGLDNFKSFQCGECGGIVKLLTGSGRTRSLIVNFPLPFPDDIKIPTCEECGETFSTVENGEELDNIVRPFLDKLLSNPKIKYIIVDSKGNDIGVGQFDTPTLASKYIRNNKNQAGYYVKWVETDSKTILFLSSSTSSKQVDFAFEKEFDAAKDAGFNIAILNSDIFFGEEPSFKYLNNKTKDIIYRGWILKNEYYKSLERSLESKECSLLNNSYSYLYSYHLPIWYEEIRLLTPKSIWKSKEKYDRESLQENFFEALSEELIKQFPNKSVIIKDYIKSRKDEWYDSCFIPDVSDISNLKRVVSNFIERQGDFLVGGIVFREFVELKKIGTRLNSHQPLFKEYRFFAVNEKIVYACPYWMDAEYATGIPEEATKLALEAAYILKNKFVAIDVAQLENNEWIVVEINDGGCAGIPDTGSLEDFYLNLFQNL